MGCLLIQTNGLANLPAHLFTQVAVPEARPTATLGRITLACLAQHGDTRLYTIMGNLLASMACSGLPGLCRFEFGIGQVQSIDKKHHIGSAANALVTVYKLALEASLGYHAQEVLLKQVCSPRIRPGAGCLVPQHKGLPCKGQALAQHKGCVCLGLYLGQQGLY